jgi:hypothetical protein
MTSRLLVKCVNAHDRCFNGAGAPCPLCEPKLPLRYEDGRYAPIRPHQTRIPRTSDECPRNERRRTTQ